MENMENMGPMGPMGPRPLWAPWAHGPWAQHVVIHFQFLKNYLRHGPHGPHGALGPKSGNSFSQKMIFEIERK